MDGQMAMDEVLDCVNAAFIKNQWSGFLQLVPPTRPTKMTQPRHAEVQVTPALHSPLNVGEKLPDRDDENDGRKTPPFQAVSTDIDDDELFPEGGRGWLVVLGCFMLSS